MGNRRDARPFVPISLAMSPELLGSRWEFFSGSQKARVGIQLWEATS